MTRESRREWLGAQVGSSKAYVCGQIRARLFPLRCIPIRADRLQGDRTTFDNAPEFRIVQLKRLSLGNNVLQRQQVGVFEPALELVEDERWGVKQLWDELRVIGKPAHLERLGRDLELDVGRLHRGTVDTVVHRPYRRAVSG